MTKTTQKKKDDYNGYFFHDKETRKRMRYIVVSDEGCDGHLAYGYRDKKELKERLKDERGTELIEAIFEVKDITDEYL